MHARLLIVLVAAISLIAMPTTPAHAAKKGSSPGKKGSQGKKSNNKKNNGSGGGSSVAKVSNNLRQKFGGIAAGKLPEAVIAYANARAKVKDAESSLTRLMRDLAAQKIEDRREVATRVQLARETYINAERYYGETMRRIQNRLKTDSQYRNLKSDLAKAQEKYNDVKQEDPESNESILTLGEVVDLESQLKELEYDAMGTDKEGLQAKSNYEDAKRDYNSTRRELLEIDHGSSGNRAQVKQAYQEVEDARRFASAKAHEVQQYKSLIKTATFQKTVLGTSSPNKNSGGKARKARKPNRR